MITESLITCILQLNICHIFIHKIKAHFTDLFHLYTRNKLHRLLGQNHSLLGEKQAVIAVKTVRISLNCEKYSPALGRKPNGNPGIGQNIVRLFLIGENTIWQFLFVAKKHSKNSHIDKIIIDIQYNS